MTSLEFKEKLLRVLKALGEVIKSIGALAFAIAWAITITCVTFGLATWSLRWWLGMLG